MKKHFNIRVLGYVQGVFFRAKARKKAEELDVTGFARNEPSGAVYIEAEGEEQPLREFLDWCHYGVENARVYSVESNEGELKNFADFKTI